MPIVALISDRAMNVRRIPIPDAQTKVLNSTLWGGRGKIIIFAEKKELYTDSSTLQYVCCNRHLNLLYIGLDNVCNSLMNWLRRQKGKNTYFCKKNLSWWWQFCQKIVMKYPSDFTGFLKTPHFFLFFFVTVQFWTTKSCDAYRLVRQTTRGEPIVIGLHWLSNKIWNFLDVWA